MVKYLTKTVIWKFHQRFWPSNTPIFRTFSWKTMAFWRLLSIGERHVCRHLLCSSVHWVLPESRPEDNYNGCAASRGDYDSLNDDDGDNGDDSDDDGADDDGNDSDDHQRFQWVSLLKRLELETWKLAWGWNLFLCQFLIISIQNHLMSNWFFSRATIFWSCI